MTAFCTEVVHSGGSRLRAAAAFVVVLLSAELLVYLTVACGLACIARIEDQVVTWPPLVVCCDTAAAPAPACERAGERPRTDG
jgi:hypothetical protein